MRAVGGYSQEHGIILCHDQLRTPSQASEGTHLAWPVQPRSTPVLTRRLKGPSRSCVLPLLPRRTTPLSAQVASTALHELIHAYDDCRAKPKGGLDWDNCRAHACTEVRVHTWCCSAQCVQCACPLAMRAHGCWPGTRRAWACCRCVRPLCLETATLSRRCGGARCMPRSRGRGLGCTRGACSGGRRCRWPSTPNARARCVAARLAQQPLASPTCARTAPGHRQPAHTCGTWCWPAFDRVLPHPSHVRCRVWLLKRLLQSWLGAWQTGSRWNPTTLPPPVPSRWSPVVLAADVLCAAPLRPSFAGCPG